MYFRMGFFEIRGNQATRELELLILRDFLEMSSEQLQYGAFMLENEGILNDLLIESKKAGHKDHFTQAPGLPHAASQYILYLAMGKRQLNKIYRC